MEGLSVSLTAEMTLSILGAAAEVGVGAVQAQRRVDGGRVRVHPQRRDGGRVGAQAVGDGQPRSVVGGGVDRLRETFGDTPTDAVPLRPPQIDATQQSSRPGGGRTSRSSSGW